MQLRGSDNMRLGLLAQVGGDKMLQIFPGKNVVQETRHGIMTKRIMMERSGEVAIACIFGIALSSLTIVSLYSPARGQSADLVLCDRLAADPTDPDKPADVKGASDIAQADIATAIKFCRVASAASRRALYQLGRAYAANQQLPEAISAYRKAADKGSTTAMVELGVLLATGSGVAKDEAQARKLFERAAEAGNPRGATNLAALSKMGGSPSDPVKARALLSKGAEANSAEAQYQLGMMTAEGIGGPKDDVAARALFERAAEQGHAGALERMGAFAQSGRGGPQDASAAKAYYEKAAALGNEDAKAALKGTSCYAVKDKRGNLVTSFCF
jgi:TPR repeat protein